ncbi:MAG: fibronectin type III domain-containing protein [Gammaproteobacteria bacterium]|nr:fibronectin type III domain-containing protein [Gammaproteobacteria bacterium]
MIISQLLKHRFTSTLFALLMALQLSACSTEDSATAVGVSAVDVSLSWVAPSEREDNTPILLSEIAGYKVYYGTAPGLYTNSVDINDGIAEGYTFKALPAATYFFVVTTYDTEGRESRYSAEVTKVV